MANLDSNSTEFKMFADFWNIYKKYYEPQESEKYWESMVEEINAFHKKYNTDFSRALALALSNEIERKWKEGKDNE